MMVGFPERMEPFLMRPFSFLSTHEDFFTILVKIAGRGTEILSEVKEGQYLKILGPLGKSFTPPKKCILIAGGIGIAPLFFQSQWMEGGKLFYGARKKEDLVLIDEFKKRNFKVNTITEEKQGTVCDLARDRKNEIMDNQVYICGPQEMYVELRDLFPDYLKNACIYLERKMGCGIGGCKSCAVKTKSGYKLLCQEGPVFSMNQVILDE